MTYDTEVKSVFEQGQRRKGSSGFCSLLLAEQWPQHAFPHPIWFLSIADDNLQVKVPPCDKEEAWKSLRGTRGLGLLAPGSPFEDGRKGVSRPGVTAFCLGWEL